MFNKLFKSQAPTSARLPEGLRVYAIGDVHGCLYELNLLLDGIEADNAKANEALGRNDKPYIVFLGDYIDRGVDSRGVIERLITLRENNNTVFFLKGNHEASFLGFLNYPEKNESWLNWGGDETLRSYGLHSIQGRPLKALNYDARCCVPLSHLDFLNNLALTHSVGDYLFVHAGLKPGVAIEEQKEEDLLWIRKKFHQTPTHQRPMKVVVHGHQPVKEPEDKGWRINLDTGACWSGKLSAVVLENDTRRFLTT